jgi:hypothetical protein
LYFALLLLLLLLLMMGSSFVYIHNFGFFPFLPKTASFRLSRVSNAPRALANE